MKFKIFLTTVILITAVAGHSQVACPPSPGLVTINVTPKVNSDSNTKLFTYTYTVQSDAASIEDVVEIAIDVAGPISNVTNPPHWNQANFGPNVVAWYARGVDPNVPAATDGGLTPPLGRIKPGQSLTGFSFSSPHGPGAVHLWAKGFTNAPSGAVEQEAEVALDTCPNTGDFFDVALNSSTQGPVDFIPVNISIKPVAAPPVPVNPREKGATPVAILGSKGYDVGSINIASLQLGVGGATPMSNQRHLEDVNGDGLLDLVVQFPSEKIGARCNDSFLFLTGAMQDGTPIQGSQAIATVGCNSSSSK